MSDAKPKAILFDPTRYSWGPDVHWNITPAADLSADLASPETMKAIEEATTSEGEGA